MKKIVSIFAAVLSMSVVLVGGCAKISTSSSVNSNNPVGNEPPLSVVVPALNVTYEQLLEQEKIEIELWHSFSDTILNPMTDLINDFETDYPNISVKVSKIEGGYDGLKNNVLLSLASNTIPNILLGYPDHFSEYINSRAISSLNDYIFATDKRIGFETAEILDYVPNYLAENYQFDGQNYYGLPFNKSTEVFQYNKTVFDKLGLKAPTTWDEVKTAATTILNACKNGTIKKLDGTNYTTTDLETVYGMTYDSSSNFFITATRQWGGTYTVSEGAVNDPKAHIRFDKSPETKEMLAYFKDAASKNLISVAATWDGALYGTDNFLAQNVFMSVGSTAGVTKNIAVDKLGNLLFETGIAPIPQKDVTNHPAVIQQGTNIALMKKGDNFQKLASWLLIKHLTSTEVTAEFAMATGYLPVRTSAIQTAEYQEYLTNPVPADKYNSKGSNVANSQTPRMFVDPAFIGSSGVRTEVGKIMNAVLVDQSDIDTSISNAMKQIG